MSAKLTLRKRNKKFNQTRKDAIKAIKNAINNGKYSTDFLLFWTYFTDQGYRLLDRSRNSRQKIPKIFFFLSWDIDKKENQNA